MDVFAEELDILADLESSTPSNDAKPEFDQTLIKAVEEEGEPEPAHSLVCLPTNPPHRHLVKLD